MDRSIRKYWWAFLFVGLAVLVSPWVFTKVHLIDWLSFDSSSGVIGDAIAGVTAPIIGLFSAFLVYRAFVEQIKANKLFLKEREQSNIFVLFEMIDGELPKLSNDKYQGQDVLDRIRKIISQINKDESLLKQKEENNEMNATGALVKRIETNYSSLEDINKILRQFRALFTFTMRNALNSDDPFFINLFQIRFRNQISILLKLSRRVKYKDHVDNKFDEIIKEFEETLNLYKDEF